MHRPRSASPKIRPHYQSVSSVREVERLTVGARCEPCVALTLDAPVADVADQFLLTGRETLPVVDRGGTGRGVLSAVDVARASNERPASAVAELTVGDLVAAAPTCDEHESAREASLRMARGGASTALVSDADGHLVGIWTAASALGLLGSAHAGPRPPGLARPVGHVKKTVPVAAGETRIDSLVTDIIATPGGTTIVLDSLYRPLGTVGHPEICHLGCVAPSARPRTLGALASPGAVRVDADTPLSEVTGMFTRHRCEWMLVCEGASFVGIVRADELLRRLWGGESPQ